MQTLIFGRLHLKIQYPIDYSLDKKLLKWAFFTGVKIQEAQIYLYWPQIKIFQIWNWLVSCKILSKTDDNLIILQQYLRSRQSGWNIPLIEITLMPKKNFWLWLFLFHPFLLKKTPRFSRDPYSFVSWSVIDRAYSTAISDYQ